MCIEVDGPFQHQAIQWQVPVGLLWVLAVPNCGLPLLLGVAGQDTWQYALGNSVVGCASSGLGWCPWAVSQQYGHFYLAFETRLRRPD